MRRKILIALGLIVLWVLSVAGAVLAEAYWIGPPRIPRGDVAAIERHIVGKISEKELGSAAFVLVQGGKIVAEHTFGVSEPRIDQTLFLQASVSKAVTAWGVMNLVEEGKLALDEPAMRYLTRWRFPGSETYRDKVTVRHLLSHTAGLDDGLGYGGFALDEKIQTLEESLALPKDSTVGAPRPVRVAREPGTSFGYSGGSYTILQLLVEEVTHQTFSDYMKTAVLQPLGMNSSSFDFDAVDARNVAPNFDRDLSVLPHRRYTAKAACALFATPRDLGQFVRAFGGENPVLKRETLAQMLTAQPATYGGWGLGHSLYATNVAGHEGGAFPATGAAIRVNPTSGNGIALMARGGRVSLSLLADTWVQWETGEVTAASRRQMVYDRIRHASVAIVLGAIAIAIWKLRA